MNTDYGRKFLKVGFLFLLSVGVAVGQYADFKGFVANDYEQATVPDGYRGLHWSNFTVFHSPGCATVKYEFSYTGYCHIADVTGKSDMAYLYGEYGTLNPATISGDGPFVFQSVVMAAAWNNDVQVTVSGYRQGVQRYSKVISLDTGFVNCQSGPVCQLSTDSFPFVVPFGWYVDRVTITATGGYSDGVGELIFPGWHQPHIIFSSVQVQGQDDIEVPIDVQPGSANNPINLADLETVPVVIFGSPMLDAADVDLSTIRVGRNSAPPTGDQPQLLDVNHDGRLDRVFYTQTPSLGILPGDRDLCIAGLTSQGQAFFGCDLITIVTSPPNKVAAASAPAPQVQTQTAPMPSRPNRRR